MVLVDYLVARDGLPARHGLAYDYVLAGDGLYLVADNPWLAVRVPVARCAVRGLPPLHPACTLKQGRLPAGLWQQVVQVARAWATRECEILLAVTHSDVRGFQLCIPLQVVGAENVVYQPASNTVLEIHSHHRYRAGFSATDDADEQRLGLYGVVGRLDQATPEVALRVGAYGHFMPIPWEAVFEGDKGVFRDAFYADEGEGDDDLPT